MTVSVTNSLKLPLYVNHGKQSALVDAFISGIRKSLVYLLNEFPISKICVFSSFVKGNVVHMNLLKWPF